MDPLMRAPVGNVSGHRMAVEPPSEFYRRYGLTSTGEIAYELAWFAKHTVERSSIVKHLDDAIVLGRVIDRQIETKQPMEDWGHLSLMQARLYDYVTDDALLVSGLETYSKGYLASRGYVIHKIKNPGNLKEEQKERPVAISEIPDPLDNRLRSETLSCSQLLRGSYPELVQIPPQHLPQLIRICDVRNTLHMRQSSSYRITSEWLEAIRWLRDMLASASDRSYEAEQRLSAAR